MPKGVYLHKHHTKTEFQKGENHPNWKGGIYKNVKEYYREYRQKNIKKIRRYAARWARMNNNKRRASRRIMQLNISGKTIYGLNKRPYTGYCEICGRRKLRFVYHHWDNSNYNKGIWVCTHCHWAVEGVEKGYDGIYKNLKQKIEKE